MERTQRGTLTCETILFFSINQHKGRGAHGACEERSGAGPSSGNSAQDAGMLGVLAYDSFLPFYLSLLPFSVCFSPSQDQAPPPPGSRGNLSLLRHSSLSFLPLPDWLPALCRLFLSPPPCLQGTAPITHGEEAERTHQGRKGTKRKITTI